MGSTVFPAASTTTTKTLNTQVFRSSGTWTYPTSANFDGTVEVLVVGGGGSGGNSTRNGGDGTGSSSHVTGGGGGGQVTRKTISVLGLGNQTVTVGGGGQGANSATVGGSCGGFSAFGAYTIANAYPDPETRWGLIKDTNGPATAFPEQLQGVGALTGLTVKSALTSTGSVTPSLGSYLTVLQFTAPASDAAYSDFFNVSASTSYNLGFSYARGASNTVAGTGTCVVFWYAADGTNISQSNISTSFTIPTSGTTWTAVSATVTTPSTAVTGRFCWSTTGGTGSPQVAINAIMAVPASTGITTAIYGLSSNYQWLGAPYKSPTILTDSKSALAMGGGGGWGVVNTNAGTWNQQAPIMGYNSGGESYCGVSSTLSTSQSLVGGCGGGSGGPAENSEIFYATYNGTSVIGMYPSDTSKNITKSFTGQLSWYESINNGGGNSGTGAVLYTGDASSMKAMASMGSNGAPIYVDGVAYGAGGIGGYTTGYASRPNFKLKGGVVQPTQQTSFVTNPTNAEVYFDAAPNTGNGGNGMSSTGGSGVNTRGGHGGSGIVIVKWYT